MSNIKFQLTKFEHVLVFQILEMNEKWRDFGELYINENNKYFKNVYSIGYPQFDEDDLNLRGRYKEDDYLLTIRRFDSNKDRDEAYLEIVNLLRECSEVWDKRPKGIGISNPYSDIYEF
jgi:hypothetical protein